MSLLKKPGSKNWVYRTMVNGKTWERSTGESDKRKAQAKVAEMMALAELHRKQPGDSMKLKAAIVKEVDVAEKDVSKAESDRVSKGLEHFFTWVQKDIPLEKITPDMLEEYQRHRLQDAALSTYNREMNYIIRMLRRNGFRLDRPKAKRGKKTKHRPFTMPELKAFLNECDYGNWVLFVTMLLTGARPAELIPSPRSSHKPLLKTELHRQTNQITIRNAKLKPNEEERMRVVPIPKSLMWDLVRLAKAQSGPYVFPSRNGSLHTTFDRIISRAKIEKVNVLNRKLTAHSFRHTYCNSLAASCGNNPFQVMGLMGHSQISTTQIYCHGATEVIDIEEILKTRPVPPKKKIPHTKSVSTGSMGKTYGEAQVNRETA